MAAWTTDEKGLYVDGRTSVPGRVYRLDMTSGRKELWKEFMPVDPAGVTAVWPRLAPDGKSYVYGYTRHLVDLFLIEGLK